ncbi:MAG: hypothetical protein ACFFG0_29685 [Candidatus Thorarchaeota archaeon]
MYKINEYISLVLKDRKTIIFLGGSEFLICKAVFVDIDTNDKGFVYDTIDEVIDDGANRIYVPISPEEEFWIHCSNLQAWAENNYNTALLHSNIAFPLLEGLVGLRDPLAKRVFKDEVIKRLLSDYTPTILNILKHGYLYIFTDEEFEFLLAEVKEKIYSLDKRVLDLVFESDDFDEVPPIDRFDIRTIIFSIDDPRLNLLELIVKFGNLYYKKYYKSFSSWIIKFLDRLVRKKPKFFREKIELFFEKGYLNLPVKKKSLGEVDQLDFSEMDDFSIILYNRYFRDMDLKKF